MDGKTGQRLSSWACPSVSFFGLALRYAERLAFPATKKLLGYALTFTILFRQKERQGIARKLFNPNGKASLSAHRTA
jgi:hypothetical protein